MATNLNALVMKISADTSGLSAGVRLTRSEISRLNRIQQMARTDSDKLRQATETLQKGFAAGAIDAERLQKGLDEVRKRYGETSEATREHARSVERGLQLVRQTEPAIEGVKQQFRDLMAAQKAGKVTNEEYARSKAELIEQTKKLKKAEFDQSEEGRRLAEQQREAEQRTRRVRNIIEASIPATERLERQIHELADEYRRGNITAKEFTRTQDRLQRELEETRADAAKQESIFGKIKGSILGIGVVVTILYSMARAARAVRDAVAESMTEIDNIAKQSKKLGLLTEELIGLRLAASEFSGMSEGQFDTALQRMTRRIAEAAKGTGEAQGAIKELGLDAQALANAGPAESFRQIAQAIQGVEGESQRLRIAFKLFDSEGAGLVTTLSAGREGIEGVEKAAADLGITFSSLDAAQVEAANDAIGRVKASIGGLSDQLAILLSPAIEQAAKDLQAFLQWINQANVSVPRTSIAVAGLYGSVTDLAKASTGLMAIASGDKLFGLQMLREASQLDGARDAIVSATNAMAKAYANAGKEATEFNEAIGETPSIDNSSVIGSINEEIDRLNERNLELKNGAEWYKEYTEFKNSMVPEGATDEQAETLKSLRDQNKILEQNAKLEAERTKAAKERIEAEKKKAEQVKGRISEYIESIKTPMEKLTEQIAEAKFQQTQGNITADEFRNAMRASTAEFRASEKEQAIKVEFPPTIRRDSQEEYRMISQLVTGQRDRSQQQHSEAMRIRQAQVDATIRVEERLANMEPAEAV